MLELAIKHGTGPVLISSIAEKQGISPKYLHAMLTSLRSAGLVRSIRGAGGGYVLAKSPKDICIDEVLRTLEGSLSLVDCVSDEKICDRSKLCATRDLWVEISKIIEGRLSSMTLEDLLARQYEKESGVGMYYI